LGAAVRARARPFVFSASYEGTCYTLPVTKYDLFRRRIVPVAMVIVGGLLAFEQCGKNERTEATFVLEYGIYNNDVRAVEAEVWMNGERVTRLRRNAVDGAYIGKTRFEASLPDTEGELRIDVDLANGDRKHVTRKLHVREGDVLTFQLEPDLR
jgi:hypothetical protein